MSRYMKTELAKMAVEEEFDRLHAMIDDLEERLERAGVGYAKLEETKYAPPAIEVIDGVISDKSQDADWLRARYFEQSARIERLEAALRVIAKFPFPETEVRATAKHALEREG